MRGFLQRQRRKLLVLGYIEAGAVVWLLAYTFLLKDMFHWWWLGLSLLLLAAIAIPGLAIVALFDVAMRRLARHYKQDTP